jgi:hypothetical protein
MSEVITKSDENIATPFRGNINGVRIVNDTNSSEYYGAIFHGGLKVTDGGECTEPILPTADVSCTSVDMSAFSADIFQWNKEDPDSSGNGIVFYNLPYGWNTDVQAGSITVYKEDIKNADSIFKKNSSDLKYDFSKVESEEADFCNTYPSCSEYEDYMEGTDDFSNGLYTLVKEGYCCSCSTMKDCLGSIRISNGGYLVGLYSKATNVFSDDKEVLYFKTATKDVENLHAYDYVESTDKKIEYIYIIPTK